MSAWPRCSFRVGKLTSLNSTALLRPGRQQNHLLVAPYHGPSLLLSEPEASKTSGRSEHKRLLLKRLRTKKVGPEPHEAARVEAERDGERLDSKKIVKGERRRLGLERLRAKIHASNLQASFDPVPGPPTVNRRSQQVVSTARKMRQQVRQQTAVRNHSISFTRKCLGIPAEHVSSYVQSQETRALQDVVFFCIDTEGGNGKVTELGIATLDTRSIIGVHPGARAREWIKRMRVRHFSTLAHGHRFGFGTTERVPLAALKPYMQSFVNPMRKYVLVGHSGHVDFAKLSQLLNYDLRLLSNVVGQIDTHDLVRVMPLPQKLGELWRHVHGISPECVFETNFSFHNAGNDAVCTLQVLLILATSPESDWVNPTLEKPLIGPFLRFYRA